MKKEVRGFYLEHIQSPMTNNEELFRRLLEAKDEYTRDMIRNDIVVANLKSIHHIIHRRYGSRLNMILTKNRMTYDDMYSIGYHSLVKAIDTFDVSLGFKFTTLSFRYIHHGFSKYFDRLKTPDTNLSIETPVSVNIIPDGKPLTISDTHALSSSDEDLEVSIVDMMYILSMFEELEKRCKPRDLQVLKAYVHSPDTSQSEFGKIFGMSQAHVSRIIKRVQATAREIRNEITLGEVI